MKLGKAITRLFAAALSMTIFWGLTTPAMAWPNPPGAPILFTGYSTLFVQKADGTVWGWGSNNYNQLLNGSFAHETAPVLVEEIRNVKKISCYQTHVAIIKQDDTLWLWGSNEKGQLGTGDAEDAYEPIEVSLPNKVLDVVAANGHTMALCDDGSLWTWGGNTYGQLGIGNKIDQYSPVQVPGNWNRIWGFCYTSFAENTNGQIYVWGYSNGQLGSAQDTTTPQLVSSLNDVDDISGCVYNFSAISGTSLLTWGQNIRGELGLGHTTKLNTPTQVTLNLPVVQAASGQQYTMALLSDGTVWNWGWNEDLLLGRETESEVNPIPERVPGLDNIVGIKAGYRCSFAINADGSLWGWGNYKSGNQSGTGQDFVEEPSFVMYLWENDDPTRIWVEVPVGGTVDLRATALPSEFEIKPAVWTSSNEPIATVDNEGVVTGVTPGIAFITAETLDGQHEATIGVLVVDSDIEAMRLEVKLRPGYSAKLVAADYNANISNDVVWTSADPVTVSVDANGRVTAGDDRGAVTIVSATSQAGEFLGSVYVRIV